MNKIREISGNTKITSDTHFGHKNIEKYEPIRVEMAANSGYQNSNDFLIDNWNKDVKKDEIVLHLGDYAFESPQNTFGVLNGKIILIVGNHDKKKAKFYKKNFYEVIDSPIIDLPNISQEEILEEFDKLFLDENNQRNALVCCLIKEFSGKKIMFSHFPVYDNNPYDKKYTQVREQLEWLYEKTGCELNVYGHTHSHKSAFKKSISATVENTNMRILDIKTLLEQK